MESSNSGEGGAAAPPTLEAIVASQAEQLARQERAIEALRADVKLLTQQLEALTAKQDGRPAPIDTGDDSAGSSKGSSGTSRVSLKFHASPPEPLSPLPLTLTTSQATASSRTSITEASVAIALTAPKPAPGRSPSRLPMLPEHTLQTIEGTQIPLLIFVNSRSGGRKGETVMDNCCKWYGEAQVCDLARVREGGPPPEALLRQHIHVPGCRVLVAGGDGTCGWILNAITKVCTEARRDVGATMPIGVMPLGTGNDLSRALGWGSGYKTSMASHEWTRRLAAGTPEPLDRWRVTVPACRGLPKAFSPLIGARGTMGGTARHRGILLNYLSVGTEAAGLCASPCPTPPCLALPIGSSIRCPAVQRPPAPPH